ncbi:MAG: CHAD domain-containing protein [Bellilinea sp.]
MKIKANPNLQIYGAATMMAHLAALVQEMEGVRLAKDIEAVHHMRVASRRLRATLPLFGQQLAGKRHLVWIKTMRGVTRALGEARDSDVQIEHVSKFLESVQPPNRSGVRRLLLRLRQQRLALQPQVMKELNKFEKSGVIAEIAQKLAPFDIYRDRLDVNDPGLLKLADRAIRARLGEFLGFDAIVDQPERVEELHAMRISAKRLRYTLETFAPLFEDGLKNYLKSMRNAQDMLGTIHDCDVWAVYIPQFMDEERLRTAEYFGSVRTFKRLAPGLSLYQDARRNERDTVYAAFRETWAGWKSEGLWENLTAILEARMTPVVKPPLQPAENAAAEISAPVEATERDETNLTPADDSDTE